MNIWITSDTHFSHTNLIQYGRPKDFEEKIKKYLLENVRQEDWLIHLGDVCIGNDIDNNEWFKKNLHCKTTLILGNHDKKSISWYNKHGWDLVCERMDIKMFGKRICFSHIPTAWDGYFDLNIHGHLHDTDKRRAEEWKSLSGYNKLVALEFTDYHPILLKNIC